MTNKLVLENLKHRPVRTFLSTLAIGVQVMLMLTIVGLSDGTLDDLARRSRGVGADILIRPPGSSIIGLSSAPMSEKLVPFLEKKPHVAMASGTVVYSIGGMNTVTGIDYPRFSEMSGGFRFLDGGAFTKDDDVIVDEYQARQLNLKVGGPVEFMNRTWRVCGIVEPGKLARMFVQLRVLHELTANSGRLSVIYVKLDNPANTAAVIADFKKLLPENPIFSMEEFISQLRPDNVPGLKPFIVVVIVLSVVVGFIVVFLSMYTAVLERTREIGILKSLGASPRFVVDILFRETTLLAIIGSVAGILLSFVSRWAIQTFAPGMLNQMVVPHWWPIAAGIAVTGALLGALYPGLKAARQDAIEALSYD